jgi:hypothetical protein
MSSNHQYTLSKVITEEEFKRAQMKRIERKTNEGWQRYLALVQTDIELQLEEEAQERRAKEAYERIRKPFYSEVHFW